MRQRPLHASSPVPEPAHSIRISIARQRLQVLAAGGAVLHDLPCSTGAAGTGTEEGSGKTPTGRFCICTKHGENAPLGAIFKARIPTGTWSPACPEQDAILARILCLRGLEPHNANTRARLIYIHGTADTARLGTPVSHGCIRLAPADIARIFPLCPIGMKVEIEEIDN